MSTFFKIFALVSISASNTICAASQSSSSTEELAYQLVESFWKNVEHQHVKKYSSLLAIGFQGENINGHYDRNQQITSLENLTVTQFKLKKLKASSFDGTLVISYNFIAEGLGIVSGPCIDIWHKEDCEWKQISHTYVPFPAPI